MFPTVTVEYALLQHDWHSTNDLCPFLIHRSYSEYHKLQPWWITAALILCKTARGFMWETLPVTSGGEWSLLPTSSNPIGCITTGKYLSLLIIPCTSHQCHKRWIIPVNPYPWCREVMFVYIDQQHMWHSCCFRRLMLAGACSHFPLATVQLAGTMTNRGYLTNQYKQWDSKQQ